MNMYRFLVPSIIDNYISKYATLFFYISAIFLIIGTYSGLYIAPQDYQQGDAFRIMYVHVPCAFLSLFMYMSLFISALIYLIWRVKIYAFLYKPLIITGLMFTSLALISGSLWGKPMWGTFWVWDVRLTSELFLLLWYFLIYLYLTSSNKLIISSILILIGGVDIPIIHESVIWWNSLHQGQTLGLFSHKISNSMLYPLILNLIGFFLYSLWSILLWLRLELLTQTHSSEWVRRRYASIL